MKYCKQNLAAYNKILKKKAIREAKVIYYENEFNKNRQNMRKMWNTISVIIHKSKTKAGIIMNIYVQGRTITNPVEIAGKFNDFFINTGPTLSNEIKHKGSNDYQTYMNQDILTSFHFELIDNESLRKTLNNLHSKSSSRHDGISTFLLKYLSPALINPLRVIINQSLITGIYPNKLTVVKVIPMFTKDDKTKKDNYHPISLLSSISKLFEKVVYQLFEYFTKNKLFYDSQYGF